jgi:hypothetical protein
VQTVELGAQGMRLSLVASDAAAALSQKREENAASFLRFQFRETTKREQGLSNAARGKRS